MTEGELKWYSSLWPFDRKSGFILRSMTDGELRWYSRLWNFDMNKEHEGGVGQVAERKQQSILGVF